MSKSHGDFIWYELMTTDTAAAKAFYGDVVGLGTLDQPMPGMIYTMFTTDGVPFAGVMDQPGPAREAGAPPAWAGYVGVDDVDATAKRFEELGGKICMPPMDIPDVGRFAVVNDPQGAFISLFRWNDPSRAQALPQKARGNVGWHELLAGDGDAALEFYGKVFGWRKIHGVDMGAMGTYHIFANAKGGDAIGGMMTRPPMVPMPFWQFYLNVGSIEDAAKRVTSAGGQVINGPMEVPGGDWILHGTDPQGAMFALVGAKG